MLQRHHLVVLRQLLANVTAHPEEQRWLAGLGFTVREFVGRLATLDDPTASLVARVSVTQWSLWQRCLDAIRENSHSLEFCWCLKPDDDARGFCRICAMQISDVCD